MTAGKRDPARLGRQGKVQDAALTRHYARCQAVVSQQSQARSSPRRCA
jgi:hypothetical protein